MRLQRRQGPMKRVGSSAFAVGFHNAPSVDAFGRRATASAAMWRET